MPLGTGYLKEVWENTVTLLPIKQLGDICYDLKYSEIWLDLLNMPETQSMYIKYNFKAVEIDEEEQ